jgi:hypothetical protein
MQQPYKAEGRTIYCGETLIATFWSESDHQTHDGSHFVTSETKAPEDEEARRAARSYADRLNAEIADIPPLPATLDQFAAVLEVAKQLAEAANIPGPLRAKCVFLCRDAEEMIKRERAFATVGAELCARGMLRRVLYKCPTNPEPANAYHPVNLSTEEIDEIFRIVHGMPTGGGVDVMRQAMGRIHRDPGHSGKSYPRPLLGPAFQQPAETQAQEAARLEIPQ